MNNTEETYKLKFIPNKRFFIDDFLVRVFLGKIKFSEQEYLLLLKEPRTNQLPLADTIGKIKEISYKEGEFTVKFELFEGRFKKNVITLIENKCVFINWLISGRASYKDVDFMSKFCYFYNYRRYSVDNIDSLFCFFLEPIEK